MNHLFDLSGRVALVTGSAAGGLGQRAATVLSEAGATVALADLVERKDALEKTAAECPGPTSQHSCDVAVEASVIALMDRVIAAHGRLDCLVNAAGVMLRKKVGDTAVEEFEHVVRVNLTGSWLLGREAGRRMSAGAAGRIINISTVYAERVGPIPESAYYSSKAGVANLTRALAAEFGPLGITVNCLAPGVFYPTSMTAALSDQPEQLEWFSQRTMLGRLGDPSSDLDGALLLLASGASAYITGQVLYVDGGWSAW